ncbi:MAG: hypothetical protein JWN50_485 [Parcubacteria group bacterium]|nr:hypothetical protein [Parcubacteria group bacterium]
MSMNKKLMALLGVVTLGIGGATTIALETHAQSTTAVVPIAVAAPAVTTAAPDTDIETNDDVKTSVSAQKDTQEQGESTAADAGEVEDAAN